MPPLGIHCGKAPLLRAMAGILDRMSLADGPTAGTW